MQIDKIYEPQRFEPHWSRWWIDRGIFHASAKAAGRVFSLVIPPPNVTGSLHMGHMLEHTEIDAVVRWHRSRGEYMVNWCPRCLTAISDLEVAHEESQGHLWHIRYPVNGSDRTLVVANPP